MRSGARRDGTLRKARLLYLRQGGKESHSCAVPGYARKICAAFPSRQPPFAPPRGLEQSLKSDAVMRFAALFWSLAAFLCAACAAHLDGRTFHKRDVVYRIGELEPGFRRVDVAGNDLAFYKPGAGSIAVNALCRDYDDVPHEALLNHLLFGTTQRAYVRDEEVTLDGRSARHALIDAELDGVPVRLEVYLLTRARCVFDLSYISDRSAPARDTFARFVRGFRIEQVGLD
jgi:hypothetical protein